MIKMFLAVFFERAIIATAQLAVRVSEVKQFFANHISCN